MKKITILGASGSIGSQAIDIIEQFSEQFCLRAVSVHQNVSRLLSIIQKHHHNLDYVCVSTEKDHIKHAEAEALVDLCQKHHIICLWGTDGLLEMAQYPADITVSALVGQSGVRPTWEAMAHAKRVAIANKETVVCLGPLLLERARQCGCELVPIDSEHSSLWQLLQKKRPNEIDRYVLTASGGPFRGHAKNDVYHATKKQALNHPTWSMGMKNTIDSASLMNKGLELIEASYLFELDANKIDVWVHPSSIVHAAVHLKDGSVLLHASPPDMRIPIALSLSYPSRLDLDYLKEGGEKDTNQDAIAQTKRIAMHSLPFEDVDNDVFPSINLARHAVGLGLAGTIMYNCSNEYAVQQFLNDDIQFGHIFDIVERSLERVVDINVVESYDDVVSLCDLLKQNHYWRFLT